MDEHTLAYHLSAWLDPYELLNAVKRYDRDRDGALSPEGLLISSGRLTRGEEANFAAMVENYLKGFRVPPALVDLLRLWAGSSGTSPAAWNWLRDLSLSGKVHSYSHGNGPPGAPPTVILQIEERDVVTDIIRKPILALLDVVSMLAITWRQCGATNASIYHQHNMPDPFYAYLDSQVASAFISLADPALIGGGVPKVRYRAVTVVGIPDDERRWRLAQETALRMAASTHEPI